MGTLARSCVLLALLASPVADADAPHDGDGAYQRSFSVASTALRNHLLNAGDFGYDKTTPPESNREPHSYSQAGTTVAVQVRFFKIDAVDPRTGSMQAKAWLRMEWEDLRLAWEPAAWGNLSYVYFNHPFHEEPEIWVPDIVPYNARAKVADSFESAVAIVSHTGRVKWSRPGMLDIMCKFRGLVRFVRRRATEAEALVCAAAAVARGCLLMPSGSSLDSPSTASSAGWTWAAG